MLCSPLPLTQCTSTAWELRCSPTIQAGPQQGEVSCRAHHDVLHMQLLRVQMEHATSPLATQVHPHLLHLQVRGRPTYMA